jgi:hypothetical protein
LSHSPKLFFALAIFQVGSPVFCWASLDFDPSDFVSCVAVMTGRHYHTQLFIGEDGISQTGFFFFS